MTASPRLSPPRVQRLHAVVADEIPARQPRALRRAAEVFFLAILFAVSLEAACRIEDWVQFRTPIFARERSQEDLLVRDALGMHGRPGGRFQKWALNQYGMRGPAVPIHKSPGTLRIVTAGASETFGLYESPGREYPRQLEDSLNAELRTVGVPCQPNQAEILNAAMPGMSLPTVIQDIRLRVAPLEPDFIVLYATPVSYLDDAVPVAARPDSIRRAPRNLPATNAVFPRVADRIRVQLKSVLPTFVQDRLRARQIRSMLRNHGDGWRFTALPADRLHAFESDMRQAVGAARSVGATPVVMTHANRFVGADHLDNAVLRMWEKFYPRAPGRVIVQFDSAARLAAIRVARDSGAVLVDLAPMLAKSSRSAFVDYAHFTDGGAAMVAGAVTKPIIETVERTPKTECGQSVRASSSEPSRSAVLR